MEHKPPHFHLLIQKPNRFSFYPKTSLAQIGDLIVPDITAFFDGSCGPKNPGGYVGIGVIVRDGHEVLFELSKTYSPDEIGNDTSNNLAEHMAFYALLQFFIKNNLDDQKIAIYGDSQLVVRQMIGEYKIRNGAYVTVAQNSLSLLRTFRRIPIIKWIPREQNVEADRLSKIKLGL